MPLKSRSLSAKQTAQGKSHSGQHASQGMGLTAMSVSLSTGTAAAVCPSVTDAMDMLRTLLVVVTTTAVPCRLMLKQTGLPDICNK